MRGLCVRRKEKKKKFEAERRTCGLFHPSVLAIEKKRKKDDIVGDASLLSVPSDRCAFSFPCICQKKGRKKYFEYESNIFH